MHAESFCCFFFCYLISSILAQYSKKVFIVFYLIVKHLFLLTVVLFQTSFRVFISHGSFVKYPLMYVRTFLAGLSFARPSVYFGFRNRFLRVCRVDLFAVSFLLPGHSNFCTNLECLENFFFLFICFEPPTVLLLIPWSHPSSDRKLKYLSRNQPMCHCLVSMSESPLGLHSNSRS